MLHNRLKIARRQVAKLEQKEVAERLGCQRPLISKHECGKAEPSASQLAAYCSLYGVSARWLLLGGGEPVHVEPSGDALEQEVRALFEAVYALPENERDLVLTIIEYTRALAALSGGRP